MAETFGIASGAAGVISLALQITHGLFDYYTAWRDQDQDIDSLLTSINNFSGLLTHINIKIQSPAQYDLEAKMGVEKSIQDASHNVKKLQSELERIKTNEPYPRSGVQSKIRHHVRKMKYPFRAETLAKIRTNISESRSNLSLAIEVLQVTKISEAVQKFDSIIRWKEDEETRKIINWLSSTNFWLKQADVLRQCQHGTGEWLLKDPNFLDWETGGRKDLWCQGTPGTGKTVLSSLIIDYLENDLPGPDVGMAFIYCNYKESQAQSIEYFLRATARQLIERGKVIPECVSNLYQKHRGKETVPNQEECLHLLQSLCSNSGEVYIVIDALDECVQKDGKHFWTELILQLKSSIRNLHLLCTSRHMNDPKGILQNATKIEIRASDADIHTYIKIKTNSSDYLVDFFKQDPELQQNIITVISSKSDGMFLAAQLYVECLGEKENLRSVRKSLNTLPEGLDGLYDQAMQRIRSLSSSTSRLALQVISWIVYAFRPLQFEELQHAIAMDELDPDDQYIPEDCLTSQSRIINACAGLIKVNEKTQIIGLVHYTTQEYFDQHGSLHFPNAQEDIAITCVKYLDLGTFSSGRCLTGKELDRRLNENPLLQYASRHFCDHIRVGMDSESVLKRQVQFFLNESRISCASQVLFLEQERIGFKIGSRISRRSFQGIHFAAYFGLSRVIVFLSETCNVDARDYKNRTALSYAAERGHECAAKELVEHGARPDPETEDGWTPLSLAVWYGPEFMVRLLLDHGARLDSETEDGWTPISFAAWHGHESMVRLLLDHGARPDSETKYGQTPLSCAAQSGHESIVRLLLEHGAKPLR